MAAQLMVLFAFFVGAFVLSANAIRCHQCNSYLDPGCADLDLKAGGPQSLSYLKDCNGLFESPSTFCRKLDVTMELSRERRIIRSCGFFVAKYNNTNICLNADNEGYDETICQCYGDGCNAATTSIRNLGLSTSIFGIISYVSANFLY